MPADEPDASLEPGTRLDAYELLGLVAHGGMANVWLARQRMKHGLETIVAVKTILPELSLDPAFQAMFLDEARIACRVDHAHVARLLDVGEARGHAYIVMEYVAGESLSRLRRTFARDRELVPLDVTLRVASDLCAALHAAHELVDRDGRPLHVVHRDVSPQNVLLSDGGVVKLIDFGVAKARHRFAAETSAGFAKGKARYMAPEQSEGGDIDRRADVWGAGAVLYELVAGRTPIDGPNDAAIFRTLLAGSEPVDRLPESVPEPVRNLVHTALERSPEKRFPTARVMRDAIEDAMEHLGLRATSVTIERLCAERLGERIAERRRQVEGWMRAASARDAASPGPVSGSIGTTAAVTLSADGEDRSVVSVTHEPEAPAASPRQVRSRVVAAVAAIALVTIAFGAVTLLRRSPESTRPAVAAPVSSPVPSPSAPLSTAPSQEPVAGTASSAPPLAPSASAARPPGHPLRGHAPPRATGGPHDWGGIQ
ncbi:MAG TPA: serine/threonine-protein kinase [Polyangiaceae bacterium]